MWIAILAALVAVLAAGGTALWATGAVGPSRHASFHLPDLKTRVRNLLDDRAKALLAGDEKNWLVAVDPKDANLVDSQRRIFRTLRDMKVDHYRHQVRRASRPGGVRHRVVASVAIEYCFGNPTCEPPQTEDVITFRERGDELLIVGYEPTGEVRPWEVSELRVAVGERVVIAAQPRYAGRMPAYRREADHAAAYAGRFAPKGHTMGRQLIFLGAPGEDTDLWYGGDLETTRSGLSTSLAGSDDSRVAAVETMVRADRQLDLSFTLGWHVAFGIASTGASGWSGRDGPIIAESWLPVGIADDAVYGTDPAQYDIQSDLRTYLKTWDGTLSRLEPHDGDSQAWDTAAWATVYHLIHKYGEKRFIAFFNAVARDREDYGPAAQKHLGNSLKSVESDLLSYLRGLS